MAAAGPRKAGGLQGAEPGILAAEPWSGHCEVPGGAGGGLRGRNGRWAAPDSGTTVATAVAAPAVNSCERDYYLEVHGTQPIVTALKNPLVSA